MSSNLVVDPGSWGAFYASIEALTWKLQNSRYSHYDLATTVMGDLNTQIEALISEVQTNLTAHTSNRTNAHKVNATQLGFGLVDNFKTATVAQAGEGDHDDLFVTPQGYNALATKVFGDFGSSLHHQGVNPISTFGTLSFLPPDVSGSFEGSGQTSGNSAGPMIIEDDGTLVGLRYGTTGTSEGLYYFYLPTAEDRIDNVSPIRTNYKYAPASLPTGAYCAQIYNNDSDVLLGQVKGSSTYDRFLSITNGTFDATKHYTGYYKLSDIDKSDHHGLFCTATIAGSYVYIFGAVDNAYGVTPDANGKMEVTAPLDIVVWRVPVSAVQAGGKLTLEHVTTWSTTDVYKETSSNTEILIAKCVISSDSANKPYIFANTTGVAQINAQNAQRRMQCAVNPANANQIRINYHHTLFYAGKTSGGTTSPMSLSLLLDVNAKTAVVEDSPTPATVTGGPVNPSLSSNLLTDASSYAGKALGGGNWHPNSLITARGYLLTRMSGNQPDESPLYLRSFITNFTTRFAAMRERFRQNRVIGEVSDPIVTGSAITNGFMKPQLLAGMKLMLTSNRYKENAYYTYGTVKKLGLTGSANFQYTLLTGDKINGWAPNSDRVEIADVSTPARNRFVHIITQVDSAGNLSSSPAVLWEGAGAVGTAIDGSLNITGSITFDQTELNNVAKAACTTALGAVPSSWKGLIYVPQDTAVPLIMVCCGEVLRSDGAGYRVNQSLVELNYTGARTGSITGYTVKRVIKSGIAEQQPSGCRIEQSCHGGLNIYKTAAGDYLLGIGCPTHHSAYGGAFGYVFYAAIKAGAGTIEDSTVKIFNHGYFPTSENPTPLVVPGSGLCVMDYATNRNNATAVMVMDSMATTYQEFINWISRGKFVVAAQQVEQGYLVYFTAPTQVFLAGNEYTLPAGNIDLRNIKSNPASTTFYVYVQLVDEEVSYLISTSALAPSMTLMYLGTIVTNTTQIASINVSKKVRVETFELSATRIGSAIPISTGVPSAAGNFAWRDGYLKLMAFDLTLDYNGYVKVNLRTGAVTLQMSQSGTAPDVSKTGTQYVYPSGESWAPGLVSAGGGSFDGYDTVSKTFTAIAKSDIAASGTLSAKVDNQTGRVVGSITQQPTAANDYTAIWFVNDQPGGVGRYTFDFYVHY